MSVAECIFQPPEQKPRAYKLHVFVRIGFLYGKLPRCYHGVGGIQDMGWIDVKAIPRARYSTKAFENYMSAACIYVGHNIIRYLNKIQLT